LRYVLKSRDRELVLVRDEIQILEKYFNLQKTRFRENLLIDLNVDERFYHFSLPPLVLQMLVENCIKHNVISKEKPLTIKVYAEKEILIIENNLQKKKSELSTYQGLKNIIDRFTFFTSRDVKIIETNDIFKVEIPLLTVEI
jgi:LytS/YehU family sensor histidine kinase